MTGRIVVGIDGSPQSASALDWAVGRAALGGQDLELVNIYSLPADLDFYGFQGFGANQPVAWFMEHSQQVLDAAGAHVKDVAPEVACTTTSELGSAAHVLATASEGAAAVVVGRRGLGAATSVLLGSVSNRLAVEAKCPLVVIGDGEVPTTGPVVVGVDGSDFGTNALRYAIAEASIRRTSVRAVTAFRVVEQAGAVDPELAARMRADVEAEAAETVTRALAGLAADASVGVEQVTVEGRPADAILENAGDAQLIVVGTHGRGLVRRVLLGSVSRQVLNDAERPVAVVDLPED